MIVTHSPMLWLAGSTSGSAKQSVASPEPPAPSFDPSALQLDPLGPELLAFFRGRGISEATLKRNRIMQTVRWSKKQHSPRPFAAFPYYQDGKIVNVKYRSAAKEFTQVGCCTRCLHPCQSRAWSALYVQAGHCRPLTVWCSSACSSSASSPGTHPSVHSVSGCCQCLMWKGLGATVDADAGAHARVCCCDLPGLRLD